jgi:putative phosphoesterase
MIKVGILSDTHITEITSQFRINCASAFDGCDAIIHAGDLTDISILSTFTGKDIYGVCGNMCNQATRQLLPETRIICLNGYSIGICHGTGPRHNIEERLLRLFPETDCIVYGHTHTPTCHKTGNTLFINPGSFHGTGTYGAPGTYGVLQIEKDSLKGSIHELVRRT